MTTEPTPTPTPMGMGQDRPSRPDPKRRGHIGWIVAGSLASGLVAALLLVAAPFTSAEESEVTGAVLCGFALGWAMLAVLSVRFTDQPQRWAAAPALVLGLGGLLLVVFGSTVRGALGWVWPPALLALVVWMILQMRRHLRSRGARWLLYPVFAIMALAAIGGGYESVSAGLDEDLAMPGRLIDVGGHSLHLRCSGSGSPTVILEPGAGLMSSVSGWIAPAVARETRVCVYDRAGHGWSEPADSPQDGAQTATDLHTLLERASVPGPYVLAGHSFGGLYVQTFAAQYPDDVAGLVLVDTTGRKSQATPAGSPDEKDSYNIKGRFSALLSSTAELGVARLLSRGSYDSLPPQSAQEAEATGSTVANMRSTIEEYLQANNAAGQAAALDDVGDKPVVVLTAGIGSDAAKIAAHGALAAALSTNSVHRVVDGGTHESLILDEHDSAATTQAILDVVSSVRSHESLVR
ncbi:alpha/beta hydrolase [Intrasporangium sp.]|uniref:alpha/beta fold hydrolase n=1 Tax=Intrasporangium sp. TaxID=1925024 RepID=UPI0033658C7E